MRERACTLVTSAIPKERLCFSHGAALRFHKARAVDGNPSTTAHPGEIRGWIVGMGGVMRMPTDSYWTLSATTLWILGYRRCS